MLDKAKLGNRYTCFRCGTKFYDLNRAVPSCPECGEDQREAPARDIRSLLGSGRRTKKEPEPVEEKKEEKKEEKDDSLTPDDDEDGIDLIPGDDSEAEDEEEESL